MSGPAYRIETPRLLLRCWDPADAPQLKALIDRNLDHLRPWMPWALHEPQPLATKVSLLRRWRGEFDLDRDYVYAIWSRDETVLLGACGLHTRVGPDAREIGYWTDGAHGGQGFGGEAAAALTRVALQVDRVKRVEIHCDPRNVRSAAIPRRLGYRHEATLRERLLAPDGGPRDTMIWTMLPRELSRSAALAVEVAAFAVDGRRLL